MRIQLKKVPCFFASMLMLLMVSCGRHQNPDADHIKWADSVADNAFNLMTRPNPQQAIKFIDSVYNKKEDAGIADFWRKYNVKVNYYTNYKFDTVNRRIYIDSMFTILKTHESDYKYEYAHTLFNMADLLKAERKYTLSFKYYYDGRSVAQNAADNCSMSDFSNHLGTIRYQQAQYLQALPYLKEAFREASACNSTNFYYNFILPQSILNTTALCFERLGKPDSAIFYYDKALKFIQSNQAAYPEKATFITISLGVVEGNLGGAYADKNDIALAEQYLKADIATNDRPDYAIEDAQTAKIKLIKLYIRNNRLPQADTLLKQLQHDLYSGRGKSAANDEIWTKWYNQEWHYHDKLKDVARAYYFMQRYYAITDSISLINSGLKHLDLDESLKDHEQQYELALLNKNDQLKTVYIVGATIFIAMAVGILLYVWISFKNSNKNVVDLTNLNNQMRVANAALEQSQEDNTRMMKIAAHDLRNPIGAMTSVASLILEETSQENDNYLLLETMKTSGENALQLVDDLLQVNVPVTSFKKEPLDLAALVQYCVDMLKHKLLAKNQRIELQTTPVILPLNHEKMWRVISNLVSNAIKFSPVDMAITINLQQTGQTVLLIVTDKGIGIPEGMKDKIFDIFTEARRPGTKGEESYGLGLAISKQIVEAHGGKIWFKSLTGNGTTFYVELPYAAQGA